jgi:hypothetical protein
MRTRIVRGIIVALLAGSLLVVGTAHAGFGQPGGDDLTVTATNH